MIFLLIRVTEKKASGFALLKNLQKMSKLKKYIPCKFFFIVFFFSFHKLMSKVSFEPVVSYFFFVIFFQQIGYICKRIAQELTRKKNCSGKLTHSNRFVDKSFYIYTYIFIQLYMNISRGDGSLIPSPGFWINTSQQYWALNIVLQGLLLQTCIDSTTKGPGSYKVYNKNIQVQN